MLEPQSQKQAGDFLNSIDPKLTGQALESLAFGQLPKTKSPKTKWSQHTHRLWDKVGILISSICFVHCLVSPLLVFTLPTLYLSFHNPFFHIVIALLVIPVGAFAFWQGYRLHHQSIVLALGLPGLMLVTTAAILPHWVQHLFGHITLNVFGSVLLISAHVLNRRSCACRKHPKTKT